MTLDAGPRAHERVGHIYQSVVGLALREQIFLRWKDEASHGGVARVPQAREVLEVRAARLASTDENVVVQALEPVWKSNFGRPTPSTRRRPRNCICSMDFHTVTGDQMQRHHDRIRQVRSQAFFVDKLFLGRLQFDRARERLCASQPVCRVHPTILH